jgi:hypothetical protein
MHPFYTASPNAMKPSPCTPPRQQLSNETKNTKIVYFGLVDLISTNETKQTNYLPSEIDIVRHIELPIINLFGQTIWDKI